MSTTQIKNVVDDAAVIKYLYSGIDLLDTSIASISSQVQVYLTPISTGIEYLLTHGTDYDFTTNVGYVTLLGSVATDLAISDIVLIRRETQETSLYTVFTGLNFVRAIQMQNANDQLLHLIQEGQTDNDNALIKSVDETKWEGQSLRSDDCLPATTATGWVTLSQANALISGAEIASTATGNYAKYDGTGSKTVYPLPSFPSTDVADAKIWVVINGVLQKPTDDYTYTLIDTVPTVTFVDGAPPAGTGNVVFRNLNGTVQTILGPDSIDGEAILDGTLDVNALDTATGLANRFIVFDTAGVATISTVDHTQISDFDAGVRENRLDQMAAPTNPVVLSSQKITGLATGATGTGDACTVAQMEAHVSTVTGGYDVSATTLVSTSVDTPITNGSAKAAFVIAQSAQANMKTWVELDKDGAPDVYTQIGFNAFFGGTNYGTISFFVPAGAKYKFTEDNPSSVYVQTF